MFISSVISVFFVVLFSGYLTKCIYNDFQYQYTIKQLEINDLNNQLCISTEKILSLEKEISNNQQNILKNKNIYKKLKEEEDKKIVLFKDDIKKTSDKLINYKLEVFKKQFEENFDFDILSTIQLLWNAEK